MNRKPLTLGILAESVDAYEKRVPLTPEGVRWLMRRGISVEVIASDLRVFKDAEYRKVGAKVLPHFNKVIGGHNTYFLEK